MERHPGTISIKNVFYSCYKILTWQRDISKVRLSKDYFIFITYKIYCLISYFFKNESKIYQNMVLNSCLFCNNGFYARQREF